MADELTKRPDHPWGGDDEGHNCEGCPDGSIWRCDKAAHMPPLHNIRDLLTDDENKKLNDDLAELSRQRRRAAATAKDIPLS